MKAICISAIVLISVLLFSCSKSNSNSHPTGPVDSCKIVLPILQAGANGSVTYSVSLTGNGKVDKINYLSTDSVVINSPKLPYSIKIPVLMGAGVGMSVSGTTSGGTINASYTFTPSDTSAAVTNSQNCGN